MNVHLFYLQILHMFIYSTYKSSTCSSILPTNPPHVHLFYLQILHMFIYSTYRGLWVLNAIFDNILATFISWLSVLLLEETGVPGENHRPVTSHWQTLSHNAVSSIPPVSDIQIHSIIGDRHWLHK